MTAIILPKKEKEKIVNYIKSGVCRNEHCMQMDKLNIILKKEAE